MSLNTCLRSALLCTSLHDFADLSCRFSENVSIDDGASAKTPRAGMLRNGVHGWALSLREYSRWRHKDVAHKACCGEMLTQQKSPTVTLLSVFSGTHGQTFGVGPAPLFVENQISKRWFPAHKAQSLEATSLGHLPVFKCGI
ncbi:hypothetical protein CEXT_763871 [Caerostris extrusa]|uniref:Secreted protein n=1 Tax=Caerostris extrusa TaxID=172846 RepID=A0AAV4S0K5_CAEEX|nr:hypothetical protein CEXT_763871 [Caerostris extrusa]